MSRIKYFTPIFFVFTVFSAEAQKRNYTITEATNGIGTTLAPKSIKKGSWLTGTDRFSFVANNALVSQDPDGNHVDTLLSVSSINRDYFHKDSISALPAIMQLGKGRFYFQQDSEIVIKAGDSWSTVRLPNKADNLTQEPVKGNFAFTIDNNISIWYNGSLQKVTNDAEKDIVNGKSVHRDEFGIDHGLFWSPKGNLLAYYRMDQTMVADYPIIDWSGIPAQNHNIKYPMAGRTSHQVTLVVYNPATDKRVILHTGLPADQYLTGITWSPDEKYIYIGILNRDQNHLWLNQYDVATGAMVKTLLEETDPKYVHPEHSLTFLPNSNDQFVWWSQKDGYQHLYLYKTDGSLVRQLTKGNWVVNELLGFNEKAHELIYTSAQESPLEKHSYAVNYQNGKTHRIDNEAGFHSVSASDDGKYLYDVWSAAGVPKVAALRSVDGMKTKVLLQSEDPLKDYNRPEIRNITLSAEDGTLLYGKLILPTSFDSTKKYPVIVYLYNGPNVQLIHNSFPESGNLWYEYMAQRGYIVFTMDGRGSDNRGKVFEQATFKDLGTIELKDQLKGVDFLKSLSYVDAGRMGIHGWSFGGFMTTSMMLRYPDVFKCAVAGGPVIDWRMYEVMYTERYMSTPEKNKEGYEHADLLTMVKKLKGKLLLIHGTNDDVVVWQHSIKFIKKSVDEGVQVDYFVYPGHLHNVRGKDRAHLMQKITDYFDLYLKP